MCFSATASFTASTVLGLVGTAGLIKTQNKKAWPLMAMPLFFALQQFVEGLLWISLKSYPQYVLPLTHVFLFFALFFWPTYLPLAALSLETHKARRTIITFFSIAGTVVGAIFYASFLRNPESAEIVNRCLYYPDLAPYPHLLGYLYILATIGAGAASSKPIVKLYSLLILVFSLITWYFYAVNFTSVWCFFAAIISLVLFFYPRK